MEIFILILEIIGTVAFAISGAITAIKKRMDIFGICVLGLTTATGGGIIRDLILGITPPSTFRDPIYIIVAISTSVVTFLPFVRRYFEKKHTLLELLLLVSDSAGLGIFTVVGAKIAVDAGFGDNGFLVVFVAVLTGVGGGVMRDVFAGDRPYIFVKHVYASASIAGALVCFLLFYLVPALPEYVSMLIGFVVVMTIRFLAARFRLNLPRP